MSGMTLREYQEWTRATAVYHGRGHAAGLHYTVLGLVGEAGELAQKVKKRLRDAGGDLTAPDFRRDMMLELGDCLWYVARLAEELGYGLDEAAQANLDKLAERRLRGTLQGSGDGR